MHVSSQPSSAPVLPDMLFLVLALTNLILWSWSDFLCRSGDVNEPGSVLLCLQINLLNTSQNYDTSGFVATSDPSKLSLVGGCGWWVFRLFTSIPSNFHTANSLTVKMLASSDSHYEIIVKLLKCFVVAQSYITVLIRFFTRSFISLNLHTPWS